MDLVYIEWLDSASINKGEWLDLDSDIDILYCRSVGWIVHETDQFLAVAPHTNGDSFDGNALNQVCGVLCIPKVSIIQKLPIVIVLGE